MPNSNGKKKQHRNVENEKTKPYKVNHKKKKPIKKHIEQEVSENGKRPKAKKSKKNKFSNRHPKFMLFIKIMIVLFLLLCVIGAGIVAGLFFGLFGTDFEITKDDLTIRASNSVIVDQNGAVIAELSGDEKRKIITLEDMADYLPKAYVAIEDERFYNHSGVDFKRTAGAILGKVLGKSSYGGSTITQQLVKNLTQEKETEGMAGILRKVKEWAKAYQVERMISKSQILELYLNILFVGSGNLHGVELGAEYYFNKSAKDLDLAECAFMAGINSSPNAYDPFNSEVDNTEKIKNKTKTVLAKMKELGYIENQEEYDAAVAKVDAGLPFQKSELASVASNYSYHTDAVLEQVIEQVMEERGVVREIAENYIYSSGLKIYSTVDANIQARVEQETNQAKYVKSGREKKKDGTLENDQTQAAMVIIDHKTGNVLGVSGGLGQKTARSLNRATQGLRQPGSSIKPIADIAPALEEKIITASTIYNDVPTKFGNYPPKNAGNSYRGLINIREIIAYSQNVPEVKIMCELTPAKSIDYLRNFGITSLYKAGEDARKNDENLSLAIGGISDGISPLEMAAAYATIANDGEYIEPTFYTKVEDSNGNTVLTPKQERRRVISEQNAYIVKSILTEPVKRSGGTATFCAISGIDVAAKTGTTDEDKDRWLCGFTPYYAAACWFGYDNPERVTGFGTNPAGQIWDAVMTDIHKGLPGATFTQPSGIVTQNICKTTGCIAVSGCGATYKEIFTPDNLPDKCEGHGSQVICTATEKVATPYCSQYCVVRENVYGGVVPKEKLKMWTPSGATASGKITETCTEHTKPKEEKPKVNTNNTNTNNTSANTVKDNSNNVVGNKTGGNSTNTTPTQNTTNNTP